MNECYNAYRTKEEEKNVRILGSDLESGRDPERRSVPSPVPEIKGMSTMRKGEMTYVDAEYFWRRFI